MSNFPSNEEPPTKFEFLEAAYQLVELKEKLKDPSNIKMEELLKLGEKISLIHSYVYNFNIDEYVPFAEWILTYFEFLRSLDEVERLEKSYGLPTVSKPCSQEDPKETDKDDRGS